MKQNKLNKNKTNLAKTKISKILSSGLRFGLRVVLTILFLSINNYTNAQVGANDPTFDPGTGADQSVFTTAIQSNGKIIIGGMYTAYNGTSRNRIARVNADGTIDLTFDPGTGASGNVNATAVQSDGKIIIGGSFVTYNGVTKNGIARLNANGTVDPFWNTGTGLDGAINTIAVQSDGKIIIGGVFLNFNGTARARIARLTTTGVLDGTFNPGTGVNGGFVYTSAVQSDGKIIIGGDFTTYGGIARKGIARLNADGTLDATFTVGTGVNLAVKTTAIQSDGKIIIGGDFTTYNGTARAGIARLNANGTLDATFTVGTGANLAVETTTIQSDGKIITGGRFTTYNGTARNRIARLNGDGTLDVTFDPGTGAVGFVYSAAIQSDGKIIIGGAFNTYYGIARNCVARILVCTQPTITGTLTVCVGAATTLTGSATAYSITPWSSATTTVATVSSTGVVTGVAAGASVITYMNTGGCTQTATITVNSLPIITVNSGTICSGQSFTMTPSGAATYTYSSGSAVVTPTINASYNVTGTSAFGCVSSNTAVSTVTVNSLPTITVNSGTICSGQSFTMTPSGAATYTYSSGSPVVSPTINASYNITGTSALGCVSSNTAVSTVTVNSLPIITVNSGTICSGQSFTMTPSGAVTYTYSSGSAVVTPTINASYNVTGTSALGCVSSNTAVSTVTVNSLPIITVNSGTICSGQSFTMTPSGAVTYTYSSGSAVVTPTINASYNVTGTSALGCVSSNTAVSTVTVNSLPIVSLDFSAINLQCVNVNSVTLVGGSPSSGVYSGIGVTSGVFSPSSAGVGTHTITYTFTDGNNCSAADADNIVVDACTGIATLSLESFNIYPNPNNGTLTIKSPVFPANVSVFDINGKHVISQNITSLETLIDLSNVVNGVYQLNIVTEQQSFKYKIMINK